MNCIRQANIEDLETIVKFNYNVAKETEGLTLDTDVLKKGVRNLIENPSRGKYYVCLVDNKIVGQLMYTHEWSDWRNGDFLWIQSVYVDKEYRKKGVFKSLYNKIKEISDECNNIVGIRLYVENENKIAQKTYKSIGMNECSYTMFETNH